MTLTHSQPDPALDPGVIRLVGHGSTVTAEDLRTQLVLASDLAESTAIDASETLSVGQAVLQLLIAARHEAGLRNQPFHFTGASVAFSDRVQGCQLADAIGLETGKDISQ
ncbi:hypothetical protein BH10PSE14_BH10PSE14_24100 [soil metagenome]